jgi:8-oxo-dGTP pyrophosphatase MutT (NUDIX family)
VNDHLHTESLRELLQKRLERFQPKNAGASANEGSDELSLDNANNTAELKQAAVALTILNDGGKPSLIVTRRTSKLKDHGGQWALPGGRLDPDETAIFAARRELHEEISLDLAPDAMIGTLDEYVTRSGYVITPVVFWSDATPNDLIASPDEVQSIHMFSFNELQRTDSPNLETIPESDRQVLSMNYLDDVIYSPTAAMLYQFREVCLFDNHTRVAHYDQPVFAWK